MAYKMLSTSGFMVLAPSQTTRRHKATHRRLAIVHSMITQAAAEPARCFYVHTGMEHCPWNATQSDIYRMKRIRHQKSVRYRTKTIESAFPGEQDYVFNRGMQPTHAVESVRAEPPALSSLFSTVVVRAGAHLAPPTELWTDRNISYLDENAGRRLPLFQQRAVSSPKLEFLGCYRIIRWTLCEARGQDVLAFAEQLHALHADAAPEDWMEMVARDWAKVELELVIDPILSGRLHHRYVVRYAWHVASRDPGNSSLRDMCNGWQATQMVVK